MKKKKNNLGLWIALSISFLVLVGGILVYATSRNQTGGSRSHTETYTDIGFDTPITFSMEGTDEEFEKYSKMVKDLYTGYNALFDQYHEYEGINNIATLNNKAAKEPVEVEDGLIEVLELAKKESELSEKFDISEGKLISLWHDAREAETPYLPKDEDIKKAMEHTGVEGIEINGNEVKFTDDSLQLDLGGIAKGYTSQLVADELQKEGLKHGYINAGGNVVLIGEKSDGSDWVIGIQDPASEGSLVQFKTKKPATIVTSGDYQRYMEVDGKRYSHIIDPDTGYPPEYIRSVTVIDSDSGKADAMSTALFCMSIEDGLKFAEENGINAVWIVDKEKEPADAEPLYETKSFGIYTTEGLEDQISLTSAS